jgi:hypothetical protein
LEVEDWYEKRNQRLAQFLLPQDGLRKSLNTKDLRKPPPAADVSRWISSTYER